MNPRTLRYQIAREAARSIATGESAHYYQAKRKAAQRVGSQHPKDLPTNTEIHEALVEYQQLFQAEQHSSNLNRLRQAAADAMVFLQPFRPRLAGSLVDGSAVEHSEINLFLYPQYSEEVGMYLDDNRIPARLTERSLRLPHGRHITVPEYRLMADDIPIWLTVFAGNLRQEKPLSPVDGKPMKTLSDKELNLLLETEQPLPAAISR